MNKAYEKAIASARYFRNKGEIDMWHCVWHEGKPYDYHLFVDFDYEQNKDICMMVVYKTYKLKDGTYDIDCNDSLYVHQFKDLSKEQWKQFGGQSCDKCGSTEQSSKDMKQCFTNLLLCDDCYTETRILVADHLGVTLQDLKL